ncbi:hypothetical protein RUND412_010362 [Rhizina undulata]
MSLKASVSKTAAAIANRIEIVICNPVETPMASESGEASRTTESDDHGIDADNGNALNEATASEKKSLHQSTEDEAVGSRTAQDFTCVICLEIWDYPTKIADCKHLCCLKCAVRHIKTSGLEHGTCPSCDLPFLLRYQVENKARKVRDRWLEQNPGQRVKDDRKWPRLYILSLRSYRTELKKRNSGRKSLDLADSH